MENKVARFDLTLLLGESEQGLSGSLEYNSCLFDDISIEQMMENYQVLLEALVADPEQRVWDLPLHSAQPELVRSGGDAPSGFGPLVEEKTREQFDLYERFALQARRTPLSPALVYGAEQLSYQELHERASLLAEKLHEQGMVSGTPVGLALERSLDQVVGLLAVLKGGGIAVPLEEELRDALIDEACVRMVLTRKDEAALFQLRGLICLCLEKEASFSHSLQVMLPASDGASSPFEQPASGEQAFPAFAFLPRLEDLFTEGSVGVYQGYEQVGAFLDHALQQGWGSRIKAGSVWSLLSSAHFIYELFLPLLAGGTAYLVPEERRLTGVLYSAWLSEQQITSAYVPTLLLSALLSSAREGHLSRLRLLLIQAEAYPERRLVELQEHLPEALIFNGYGSPEIGMWQTLYALHPTPEPHRVTPVGRPYENDRVLLLDTFLHPVPRGVFGELYIQRAGAALRAGTGSKARHSLTRISDPERGSLSKTGACARLLPGGDLELIGFKEQSLDVQGLRVWPAESAALLAAQPGVHQAVALVREGKEGKRELVAYVVPEQGYETSSLQATLELVLKEQLPIFCVPSALLLLEKLPLTRHGLLDVLALPQIKYVSPDQGVQKETSISPLESDLVAIWRRLLKLENVSVRDNFFDRGGHSLLLVRLHNEIQSSLKLDISILDLFKYPTIQSLAAYIQHEYQSDTKGQREQVDLQKRKMYKEIQEIDSRAEKQKEILLRQRALMKEKRKSYATE